MGMIIIVSIQGHREREEKNIYRSDVVEIELDVVENLTAPNDVRKEWTCDGCRCSKSAGSCKPKIASYNKTTENMSGNILFVLRFCSSSKLLISPAFASTSHLAFQRALLIT
jgi:predicted metal-binding protein